MNRTYIIGEIGINHNGDLNIAKKLIDIAAAAGCDAVKFQKRNPDVSVPEHQKTVERDTPWGRMTYLDYKHRMEFGKDEFDEIDMYCRDRGIDWSASVWDTDSLQFITKFYDVPWIKVPSAHATNGELLRATLDTGKQVIVSTGMCTEDEVLKIIDTVREYAQRNPDVKHVIMHTNSTYPSEINDLHLSYIGHLKGLSGGDFDIGYSGHEFRLGTTVASIYLGASYIERHITLDRSMWGTDQLGSVEPQGLFKLVSGIRELEHAYGDGASERILTESEIPVRKKLRGN